MCVEVAKYRQSINDKGNSPFRVEDMEEFLNSFSTLNDIKGPDLRQITDAHFKVHSTYVPRVDVRSHKEEDEEDDVGMYLDLEAPDTKE